MEIQGSVITQSGVTFALVLVREHVMDSPSQRDDTLKWGMLFFGVPTILMSDRRFRTWGRRDIVSFLSNVAVEQIPWQRYTVAG